MLEDCENLNYKSTEHSEITRCAELHFVAYCDVSFSFLFWLLNTIQSLFPVLLAELQSPGNITYAGSLGFIHSFQRFLEKVN
jgi:hypothetical protein